MKNITLLFFLCTALFFAGGAHAAFEFRGTHARLLALGNLHDNPAEGERRTSYSLESSYSEIFGLSELQEGKLAFGLPTMKWGRIKFLAARFGIGDYQESYYGLQHGFSIGSRVWLGYRMREMFLEISEYGKDSITSVDCGLDVRITPRTHIGVLAFNVNSPVTGRVRQDIPGGLVTMFSGTIFHSLSLNIEAEKTMRRPFSFRSGLEYSVARYFFLRAGVQSYPLRLGAGLGFDFKKILVDYGYFSHAELPGQHYVTFKYNFGFQE